MDTLPTDVEVTIRRQDYDAINSRLSDGEEVEVEIDSEALLHRRARSAFSTRSRRSPAPSSRTRSSSSRPTSTRGMGRSPREPKTTAPGSSVTLEAARILMEAGAKRAPHDSLLPLDRRRARACSAAAPTSRASPKKSSPRSRRASSTMAAPTIRVVFFCVADMRTDAHRGHTARCSEAFPEPSRSTSSFATQMPRGGSSDHASFNREGRAGILLDREEPSRGSRGWVTASLGTPSTTRSSTRSRNTLIQSATCSGRDGVQPGDGGHSPPALRAGARARRADPDEEATEALEAGDFVAVFESPLTGNWDGVFTEPDMPFSLTFKVERQG